LKKQDLSGKMKISNRRLLQIIKEELETPPYVLERSGVSWDERFFVEIVGGRTIVYGPFELAEQFLSIQDAERAQRIIDDIDGYYTSVRPTSFFQ